MKPLIIVGASVRAAAFSALKAGFSPHALDCFADRDLTAVCDAIRVEDYPRGLPQALQEAPDAPWLYTGGLENYPRLVDQMAAMRPLLGNPGNVLRRVRGPQNLAFAATHAGLAFPRLEHS